MGLTLNEIEWKFIDKKKHLSKSVMFITDDKYFIVLPGSYAIEIISFINFSWVTQRKYRIHVSPVIKKIQS